MKKQKSVVTEHDYEKDVSSSIQWNRWLLIPIGAWPNFRKSTMGKYFSSLINILCFGLIAFMFVSCGLYALIEIEELYHKIELLGPLIFFLMTFIKYYLLILHENDIREGCKCIEWDWMNIEHQEDRNIMTVNANYGRRLAAICTFFLFSAFAFHYIIVPTSMGKVVDESGNLSFASLPFPVPGFIADVRYSPCNEIFYFIQTLTGAVMHTVTSAACSIAAVFAVHACGQMKVMMNWLEHLVDGRPDMSNTVNGRIAKIVIQHNRILKFLALTENALQQISFVEFLGCMLIMCLLGYYLITEWNSKDIMLSITHMALMTSFTFNIFIFCYIGELVAEQCKKVGEMTYMIDWYRLSGKKKLGCILIIAMSNSSIKFTAGNMIELSISTFSDVVKTAMAFLNMLRALT
ncbi:odorant receptor 25 [Bombus fervidus]|uniref:odorant receptor 25 n=1 Tax=Bombus fervidus TaxID=203811 RepID=UPI003AB49AF2